MNQEQVECPICGEVGQCDADSGLNERLERLCNFAKLHCGIDARIVDSVLLVKEQGETKWTPVQSLRELKDWLGY